MANLVEPLLESNRKIIDAMGDALKNAGGYVSKNWGEQGFSGVYNNMVKKEQGFGEAIRNAYTTVGEDGARNLNVGAVAGSYLGASAGYRVLSGGGVYRDKNGNANIIGIPFV